MNEQEIDEKRYFVINCFQPASAIAEPQRFAGRKEAISALTDALYTDGSCPIIYGERGLGKTSLAHQIERIALGDVELLENLSLESRALPPEHRFVTFFLPCTDDINSKDKLLQRIINASQGYRDKDHLPNQQNSHTTKHKINLKFYESEVSKSYKQEDRYQEFVNLSLEEKLQACVNQVFEDEDKKVLIIIDELDRVVDTTGLASIIKSLSSNNLKFLLVGIAHDISTLLEDHESLGRSLFPVSMEPMNKEELETIVFLVGRLLKILDIPIKFRKSATDALVQHAGGFPWFVHTIGQAALLQAYDSDDSEVTDEHVGNAVSGLAENRYARHFEDAYLTVVGDSPQREIVLRLFAKWPEVDVPTSEIYRIASQLEVSNPSNFVRRFTGQKGGRVLVLPPFRKAGIYRFRNAMFKRYICLRDSVFRGVGERVEVAWREFFRIGDSH